MQANEQQTEEKKVNALTLWNILLIQGLQRHLFKRTASRAERAISLMAVGERSEKAMQFAQVFETTKHRVIVDSAIAKLEQHKKKSAEIVERIKGTWQIQFKERRELKLALIVEEAHIKATSETLLLLVNTPPPPMMDEAFVKAEKECEQAFTPTPANVGEVAEMKLSKN